MGRDRELAPVAPEFFVSDVGATVRFYTETLGFDAVRLETEGSVPVFAVLGLGDAVVLIDRQESIGGAPATPRGLAVNIRVMVPDVDVVYGRARAAGATISRDIGDRDYGLRDFIVRDPDGFRIRFASPVRR
ncbi:MAG TPA: VOC family protein [Dehalococcoidia bacterium]|nr:VOC family protein [Dehalococcoidia bacterium]